MAKLLMLIRFRLRLIRLALHLAPIAGGSGEESEEEAAEEEGSEEETAEEDSEEPGSEAEEEESASGADKSEPDWKKMARKHEREAKKARKERDENAKKLKDREDADKSEQEKAIDEAKKTARTEAETSFETERRKDRLELATTKLAAKGVTIGEGDDAKTVKFADPEDALVHLERDIRNGDLDNEDIFDENGKVRSDQLEEALTDLLSRKPHLAASEAGRAKVTGTADARKGSAPKTESSMEDEMKKVRRNKGGAAAPQYAVGRQV